MKKAAFLLFGLSIASASHAQRFHWGAKGGITISNYAGQGTDDFKPLAGFHGGLVGNLPLDQDDSFSLQSELLYTQRGASVVQDGRRFTSRLHYIDLPVLARLRIAGFLVEAGPQFGYLVDNDKRFTGPAVSVTYQKVDVGYVGGIGYQLPNGVNAGVRYNGGLSDIFNEVIGGTINPRNTAFQLYVGYLVGKH